MPQATYRMKELVAATGVPKTTIHFYMREGLLPAGEKTARNAALYTEEHLKRLRVISQLRSGPVPAPLPLVRRALDLVDKGVPPELAVRLERSVHGDQADAGDGTYSVEELSERSGLEPGTVRELVDFGVLMLSPGSSRADGLDLEVVKRLAPLLQHSGADPRALRPIVDGIRGVVRAEMDLRDQMVVGASATEAAETSAIGQEFVNVWHPYLFFRARLHEIASRGLGVEEGGPVQLSSD